MLLAGAAVGQVVYTALCMGKVATRLGMRRAYIYGSLAAGAALAAVPVLPRLLYASGHARRASAIACTSVIYCVYTCSM